MDNVTTGTQHFVFSITGVAALSELATTQFFDQIKIGYFHNRLMTLQYCGKNY